MPIDGMGCGGAGRGQSIAPITSQNEANDFAELMGSNPNVGYAGMHANPNHVMGAQATAQLGEQHSGTDHLMMSGLGMAGDGQQDFNLYNTNGDYDLSSYITGNQYVVQDVTQRVIEDNEGLAQRAANGNMNALEKLENKVAQELTNVNDIDDIEDRSLRRAYVEQGRSMGLSRDEMEHLLHTPISEIGSGSLIDSNSSISGSLHTVDLDRTRATSMGNGLYEVQLVSNNGKNNAHDNMDISTFYTQARSADQAVDLVNNAAERGDLDADGRYNLTDAGMNILLNNLSLV